MRTFLTSLIALFIATACGIVALAAVRIADHGFDRLADQHGPNARLFFAFVAPFGVVLFGLLLDRASRLVSRFHLSAAEKSFAA